MLYVTYTDHLRLNAYVRETKPLLSETGELRHVALQYASKQLTKLLLGHRVRRRWALGPDRTLRVLDYITRVSFDDHTTTAEVNFLRDCDVRLSPRFYCDYLVTIEDLLGVLLHERNHPMIVGLVYPPLAALYQPEQPNNVIDDILDNGLVRSVCFTDLFERFYLGSSTDQPVATDEYGEWVRPTKWHFARWYWPLLTYRNDLAVASLNRLLQRHPVTDELKLRVLHQLMATHWGLYELFRRRLTQHLVTRHKADQRHPLFARLEGMLHDAQQTATPDGLTVEDWATLRVKAVTFSPLEVLRELRKGFALIEEISKRQAKRRGQGGVQAMPDEALKPDPGSPLLGDTVPLNGGIAKVSGDIKRLPEWTADDSNLVRLARGSLDELRQAAARFHLDESYLEPFDLYQQVLLGSAQQLNEQNYSSELWESHTQPYLPARLSRRDLLAISAGETPLDYATRSCRHAPPPCYRLIADVSGSMDRYLPLLPPFIRAIREQLEPDVLLFSGERHLVRLEEAMTQVVTNHQTEFIPVWEQILAQNWPRVLVLTDDEANEKHPCGEVFGVLRERVRAQRVVLCLVRIGDLHGPWTKMLLADNGQPLGPPHALVVLSPDAVQTTAGGR